MADAPSTANTSTSLGPILKATYGGKFKKLKEKLKK